MIPVCWFGIFRHPPAVSQHFCFDYFLRCAAGTSVVTSIKVDETIVKAGSKRVEAAVKTAVDDALANEMKQLMAMMSEVAKTMKPPG